MEKIDTRKLKPEVQQHLRNQAIRLRKAGSTYSEIGEIVGVHPTNVCKWWKVYELGGQKAVRQKKRDRRHGACRTLSNDQECQLQSMIRDKCPDQVKLPSALWTSIALQQLVKQLWSVRMSIRTVGEYLKRRGSAPQKPLKRPYEQNPKAVKRWLDKQYPSIAARVIKEKAETHWVDEIGLLNNSYYGRSYEPSGQNTDH